MLDKLGERYLFAVAQKSFEVESDAGIFNQFCTLLPLVGPNGERADPSDFPANGDVWWMVRGVRGLAEPGRLVTGMLEESREAGQPGRASYQVVFDSVEPIRGKDYVEIVDVPAAAIVKPRDLIGTTASVSFDHIPVDTVYVRWRSLLIGPFRCDSDPDIGAPGRWILRFTPEATDRTVLQYSSEQLQRIPDTKHLRLAAEVSLTDLPVHKCHVLHSCHHYLVDAAAFDDAIPTDAVRISMQTDEAIVQRLAKRFFNRTKKQTLVQLLNELRDVATDSGGQLGIDEDEVLAELTRIVTVENKSADSLGRAILQTGLLENRIKHAIEEATQRHIADNAGKVQAEINRKTAESRQQLEILEQTKTAIANELETIRRDRLRQVDTEIAHRKADFESELQQRKQGLDKQLSELERQRKLLSANLAKVAETLATNRDEIVNQFLAIAPLLEQFGLLPERRKIDSDPGYVLKNSGATTQPVSDSAASITFEIPLFITETPRAAPSITEEQFFQRFKSHVHDCGFRYRLIDLLSFHVSVKCGDLTILGGLPGTGKSSLPRIYFESLLGAELNAGSQRYLHVAVSPSWIDTRDLLGHVNALNRSFQPSESRLYQELIFAQEEFASAGARSRLYVICLDEMNLAHVEHYFSALLQVLEYPVTGRYLQCFPDNVVDQESLFGRWARVQLPQSLRFVGTVNFDETTKQLSQRLLDRVNLIRLPSEQLPAELQNTSPPRLEGEAVCLSSYQSWVHASTSYDAVLGDLIDKLRDHLRVLNCPMNPRRFTAMRRFIGSWPNEVASADIAVDLQIAQRVLPQVRGLFRPGAREAAEKIRSVLDGHTLKFEESIRFLDEIRRTESPELLFDEQSES